MPEDVRASTSAGGEDAGGAMPREALAKYLAYVLPEVAALNGTSALLLGEAIARLIEEQPEAAINPARPPKYS